MKVVRFQPYAPTAFTSRKFSWCSFELGAESTLGPWYGRKEYVTEKNSVTPPGIDPGTVRLVAQCLNHYAIPGLCASYTGTICRRWRGLGILPKVVDRPSKNVRKASIQSRLSAAIFAGGQYEGPAKIWMYQKMNFFVTNQRTDEVRNATGALQECSA